MPDAMELVRSGFSARGWDGLGWNGQLLRSFQRLAPRLTRLLGKYKRDEADIPTNFCLLLLTSVSARQRAHIVARFIPSS